MLSEKTLACPEYRGNGVMASLGNILENQNIGMINKHPTSISNPAIIGLDPNRATPIPTNMPIGIKNSILNNPLKK